MLKRANRIKKEKDFERIFRKNKSFSVDFLLFKISKSNKRQPRFAFVVSKKISKNSVKRNKIKRILSEIIRNKMSTMKDNIDVVVIVKKDITKMVFSQIKNSTELALKKALLLAKD